MNLRVKLLLPLAMLASIPMFADDGAASIAAGGLVVMGRETRIVMAREVLQISSNKVIVDYDFRNDSDEDVTTEVAFPIPDYESRTEEFDPSMQGFDDFRLWVNGMPTHFQVETRAFFKGKDYTALLTGMRVDIATFGHETSNNLSPDIQRLNAVQLLQLKRAGLIGNDYGQSNWHVRKKYYWRQTFPAHKIVHVRQEYTPSVGSGSSIRYGLGSTPDPESAKELKSFCIDDRLHSALLKIVDSSNKNVPYFYVDFILTTANTWKTPIEDFTLVVERPHLKDSVANYVSFCWGGPVTKIDADHFSAKATNFLPKKELRVGFFTVEHSAF